LEHIYVNRYFILTYTVVIIKTNYFLNLMLMFYLSDIKYIWYTCTINLFTLEWYLLLIQNQNNAYTLNE